MASLSVDDLGGGRFKIRWRERIEKEDGSSEWKDRAQRVTGKAAMTELQAKILRALETAGFYEIPKKKGVPDCDLERAAVAWVRSQAARGLAASTIKNHSLAMKRFFGAIRRVMSLGPEAVIPGSVLSKSLFADVILALRSELHETTIYNVAVAALAMWTWVSDEPAVYPGVPAAPRDQTSVLPLPPLYAAGAAPTLAEADACLRWLPSDAHVARKAAIVMRYTGLRVSQVLGIWIQDVNLVRAELQITVGKSRKEKVGRRTMPISRHLVGEMLPWVAARAGEDRLIARRKDHSGQEGRTHLPAPTLTRAWEGATAAGEARREVWAPESREFARPDHAFRAAFQAYLEERDVRDSVIDFLVGHAPGSTRRKHYTTPMEEKLRAAVDLLPAIDWRIAGENVVPLRG